MTEFARAGSQRWLQVAVDGNTALLTRAVRRGGAVPSGVAIEWASPLRSDGFGEYRDQRALRAAGIEALPNRSLPEFWPSRGPVWDGIGKASDGTAVFIEAKAHISEAASPPSRASEKSLEQIRKSLAEARRSYARRATAAWSGLFYQYANRLAHHYFLRRVNGIPSVLVFLYFLNDTEMNGPSSEAEWRGAMRLIHAALGVPADLRRFGVFDAFVDVRRLRIETSRDESL